VSNQKTKHISVYGIAYMMRAGIKCTNGIN
jgi:hypothetical protein